MKNIIAFTLCFCMLLAASCKKDFLNRPATGVMDDENFFKSPDAGYKTLVKCYQVFNDFYGYEAPRAELGNIATDDSDKGGSDAGDRPFVADLGFGRALSSNPSLNSYWANCYLGIGNCNTALENFAVTDLIDEKGYKLSAAVKTRYEAEIKFIRAYLYFDLVKIFGGVPLVDKTLTVDQSTQLKRASATQTFDFILKDLDEAAAEINLPSKNVLLPEQTGRITKEAVWAMQARVFLFFAKDNVALFEKARDAAKKVIDSRAYFLTPQFQDLYLPESYKTTEPVLSIIRGDNPALNVYGSFIPIYSSPRGQTGAWGFDQPTQDLVNEFEEGDPRLLFTIIEPGDAFPRAAGQEVLNFSSYPNTGFHSRKAYMPPTRRGAGWGDDAWTFHAIRYADVLLMYAEALLETGGNKQEVADNINLVRHRANNSRRTDAEAASRVRSIDDKVLPDIKTTDDLRAAVRHERRVELAMECNRLYDLLRWNSYIETMNMYATKSFSNGKGAAHKKGVNELFPIPQVEIDRSAKSIEQNPGY